MGVVVIGRNEGERLERSLRSALSVSPRVIYADSASTDGSPAVAERLGVAVVRLPPDGQLNAARGRNAGYAELKLRFPECNAVQFLDGDCIVQPGWIAKASAFLADHPDVAVVCGRRFEAHPEASIYNALCDQEWNTPIGEANECGGDALVRAEAFEEVGGYCSSLRAGEEPEMTARMRSKGWKIWRVDAPMTEHDAKILTFRQWWRRTQRGGYGYAQAWRVTNGLPQRLYGRNLRSAMLWALLVPLLVLAAAVATKAPLLLLVLPVLFSLQIVRIAPKSRHADKIKWAGAVMLMVAKFPEAIGALRYFLGGNDGGIPEYKSNA